MTEQIASGDAGVATGDGGVTGWISAELQHNVIQPIADFKDPDQESRRLFSELLGTAFLVTVAAGGGMMGAAFPNTISRTAAVVGPGLMVLGIIMFMGKISAAHLNPAVSTSSTRSLAQVTLLTWVQLTAVEARTTA